MLRLTEKRTPKEEETEIGSSSSYPKQSGTCSDMLNIWRRNDLAYVRTRLTVGADLDLCDDRVSLGVEKISGLSTRQGTSIGEWEGLILAFDCNVVILLKTRIRNRHVTRS